MPVYEIEKERERHTHTQRETHREIERDGAKWIKRLVSTSESRTNLECHLNYSECW